MPFNQSSNYSVKIKDLEETKNVEKILETNKFLENSQRKIKMSIILAPTLYTSYYYISISNYQLKTSTLSNYTLN